MVLEVTSPVTFAQFLIIHLISIEHTDAWGKAVLQGSETPQEIWNETGVGWNSFSSLWAMLILFPVGPMFEKSDV